MVYELNEIVAKMGEVSIEGNVIPQEWYVYLKNDKGKVQVNAILILAELVYWYRPVPIFNQNGKLIGNGKKFKEDLLQRSYKDLGEKFGFSENQSRDALIFLESKGLAYREFRNISVNGHILNNVMYLGINPPKIKEISQKKASYIPSEKDAASKEDSSKKIKPTSSEGNSLKQGTSTSQVLVPKQNQENTCSEFSEQGVGKSSIAPLKKANTNTETSSKISSNISKVNDKDWSLTFSKDEKEFLCYLLKLKPQQGESIDRDTATWWIKKFGIQKIKTALKVYWQQVDEASKNKNIPMPKSMGAYVRKALNEGIRPKQDSDLRNKSFAETFKEQKGWKHLTIRERYCRIENTGKELYYHLPEVLFHDSLINIYEISA